MSPPVEDERAASMSPEDPDGWTTAPTTPVISRLKQEGERLDKSLDNLPIGEGVGWQSTGDMPPMADDGSDWTVERFGQAVDRAGEMLGNARTGMSGPQDDTDTPTTASGQPPGQPDTPAHGPGPAGQMPM